MGACGCKPVQPIVHVPLPATLGDFDRFTQQNTFMCVEYLNEMRLADLSDPPEAPRRLCGSYAVEVVAKNGKKTEVVVKDVAEEVQLVHRLLLKQKTKNGRFKPVGDVRREACLCAANVRLLQKAPLTFTDTVDADFVNHQLPAPLMAVHITILCEVFNNINRSRSGVVSVMEITEWASRLSPSIMYSAFVFCFAEVVTTQRLHHLNVMEMIAAIDRFCIMNEEQLLRTVFEILGDTHTSSGSRALDITTVMNRFPVPASDSAQYLSMPLLKALSKLYTKRLADPELAEREPHLLTFEDFQRLSHTAAPAFSQVFSFQQLLRKETLGHKIWNRRRRQIEKLHEDGQTVAPLKGPLVKTYYLRPRRHVKSYYSVCPLDQESGDGDSEGGGGSDSDDGGMLTGRSRSSAASAGSRRSSASRRRRRQRNSGAGGSVYSATTPRSRGGRERYHSPAELSPEATKEFANALKASYSQRDTRRSRGSSRGDRYRPSSNRSRHATRDRGIFRDRMSSPSSASYEGPPDRSPRAVSPLLSVPKPPVKIPTQAPPMQGPPSQVPLPPGPPPGAGVSPFAPPTSMGGPPTMMYHGNGGMPTAATFHMGHTPVFQGGGPVGVPTPEMMGNMGYNNGPPRAHSFSGPSFHHIAAAASGMYGQRASLPAGPPPPANHYYF